VNAALLIVLTFSFTKQDRVAPLLYVYRRHDATGVLVARTTRRFVSPTTIWDDQKPPLLVLQQRDSVPVTGLAVNYVVVYSDSAEADRAFLEGALHKRLTLLTVITRVSRTGLPTPSTRATTRPATPAIYTTL